METFSETVTLCDGNLKKSYKENTENENEAQMTLA